MNKEELYLADRLKQKCVKLLHGLEDRRIAAQQAEDEDADVMGREARTIKIEPLVEVPTPLLASILEAVADKTNPDTDETFRAYRRHCKLMAGLGSTNPVAAQMLAILNLIDWPKDEPAKRVRPEPPKEDASAKV